MRMKEKQLKGSEEVKISDCCSSLPCLRCAESPLSSPLSQTVGRSGSSSVFPYLFNCTSHPFLVPLLGQRKIFEHIFCSYINNVVGKEENMFFLKRFFYFFVVLLFSFFFIFCKSNVDVLKRKKNRIIKKKKKSMIIEEVNSF